MPTFKPRPEPAPDTETGTGARPSVRWLAHEINSLLDGSMRSIRLAEEALRRAEPRDATEALERLRNAHTAMGDIATVLSRAMSGDHSTSAELLRSHRTLGEEVGHVLETLAEQAEQDGTELMVMMAPAASASPAGPLGAVLANGIRNAIEACAGAVERRVEVSISIDPSGRMLDLAIADTGPGVPEDVEPGRSGRTGGHGIGLAVCEDVVRALGGRLSLTNVPFGGGAVLRIIIPRAGLLEAGARR